MMDDWHQRQEDKAGAFALGALVGALFMMLVSCQAQHTTSWLPEDDPTDTSRD
jgi:hypothetical protein